MAKRKLKKIKLHSVKLSPLQVIIILSPLVMVLLVFLFGILVWSWLENENSMPKILSNKEYNTGRQYPIESFKTYTNEKHRFSIKYPSVGYIQDPECFKKGICNGKVSLGSCGTGITSSPMTRSSDFIQLDNMMGIIVNDYSGSIDEFIKSQGGNLADFKLDKKDITGAGEAVFATINK